MNQDQFQIRDPIHGVIFISEQERLIIDSPAFQRLRHIKQVGFAEFAFPCATHSRYSHSIGTMSVATKIFDRVVPQENMEKEHWFRLRQAVRLAALLHDVGHPPLSHTTEMLMPPRSAVSGDKNAIGQATHEDFTLQIILASPLTKVLEETFQHMGLSPHHIAGLISKDPCQFQYRSVDFTPILRQIISSEIDADRMDYLLRDSFFCGVNYGKFDSEWLLHNLVAVQLDSQMVLGLKERAIFAFEDFLISRYHMFASVYLHHTPVIMEKMLEHFFNECPNAFTLPSNIEDYISLDDMDLWYALKTSKNRFAERIIKRETYVMLDESFMCSDAYLSDLATSLMEASIDVIFSHSASVLSAKNSQYPILVKTGYDKAVPLEEFSRLYTRYKEPAEISRLFVLPEDRERALMVRDAQKSRGVKTW